MREKAALCIAELHQLWDGGQRAQAIRAVLNRWDEIVAEPGSIGWLENALRTCGLSAEACALQAHRVRQSGTTQDWEALVESVLNTGDPWWARELLREQALRSRKLQALQIETELALQREAVPALIAAWLRQHADLSAREAAVDWWIRCGHAAEAERLTEQSDDLLLWRARFALWHRQPATARALLTRVPSSPRARCLEAIAAVLEGALERAEAILRSELEGDARGEAATWLCTVLWKQRRYGEAQQIADIASVSSPSFQLVPRLERELAAMCERSGGDNPEGFTLRALRQRLALWWKPVSAIEHSEALYALGLKPRDSLLSVDAVLDRFAGNHSAYLTTSENGRLVPCVLPQDPRDLGATIQRVLWSRGPAAARALYRELAPRVNRHPLFLIYHGELELWMGEYEDAACLFHQALAQDRRTRWAWIGLGACHLFQGELKQAQDAWKKGLELTGFPGPTLFVYRGECYRRQGDVEHARADLETALRQKPQRLSARINLALLNDDRAAQERVAQECAAHAPLLMHTLEGTVSERLELVLAAMRGNRSSSSWHISYHLWGHVWRRALG